MDDKFTYNYSAPTKEERREIQDIRRRYDTKENDGDSKLKKLRKLDKKVKNLPTILSLCLGIGGTLVFGVGLTMVLEWRKLVFGIVVMLVGGVLAAVANVVYNILFTKNKQKYGAEILKLSEELLSSEPEND